MCLEIGGRHQERSRTPRRQRAGTRSVTRSHSRRCKLEVVTGALAMSLAMLLPASPAWPQTITLEADDGLFRRDIVLNGKVVVRAVIDTGSSSVGLCADMVDNLDLPPGTAVEIETPGGTIIAQRTRLTSIAVGRIVLHDVAAVVHPRSPWCEALLRTRGLATARGNDFAAQQVDACWRRQAIEGRYQPTHNEGSAYAPQATHPMRQSGRKPMTTRSMRWGESLEAISTTSLASCRCIDNPLDHLREICPIKEQLGPILRYPSSGGSGSRPRPCTASQESLRAGWADQSQVDPAGVLVPVAGL